MLPRVLEPEVMDTPDDARDYDSMDHTAVNLLFAADFLRVWNGQNHVLDVGHNIGEVVQAARIQRVAARPPATARASTRGIVPRAPDDARLG